MKKYNKDSTILVESIVCTIDILGYSQLIIDSCNSNFGNHLLKKINFIISKNKQCIIKNKYSQGKIKIYTDNMIIGYPIKDDGEDELNEILDNVSDYQFNLAMEGFFVRGGISVGDFYMNEDIVFGLALLDAHYVESNIACYPRIILDDKTVSRLQNHIKNHDTAPQWDKILIDNDGQWFINYLNAIFKKAMSHL